GDGHADDGSQSCHRGGEDVPLPRDAGLRGIVPVAARALSLLRPRGGCRGRRDTRPAPADGGGRTRAPGGPGSPAAGARTWSGVDGRAGARSRAVGLAGAVGRPAAPGLAVAAAAAGTADPRRRPRARAAEPDRSRGTAVSRAAREPRPGRRGTRWRRA